MIDKETVDRILDAADIVDVVSDFVHLRRRGSNYIGLCPFHNEKTPSFSVSRSKGICKCFSCGKGGSPVNFIMEHEQMSYYEALKYLANKYHIEIKEREYTDEERQAQSERENMLLVNDFALKHFEHNLFETEEGRNIGLSYFYERGFNDAIIKKFHLGYSLDHRSHLYESIKAKGLNPKFAVDTGLCIQSDRGIYDRFKGRVMFPVLNIAGKVIAFGGRTLKNDPAKYVNSPESTIYKKKNELYGLYQAKQAIVKKENCYLVEGYTDVLSMHQAGIENVVASSGTSLTEGQIRLIHRFSENITVLYDGDSAGIKASLRGIDLLLAEGLNVKVLLLPDGDDPDSFARKHSASEFQDYIAEHETDFIKFKISILLEGVENDPIKKAAAISDIVRSIAVIPSEISRALYQKECSTRFEIEEKIIASEVRKAIEKNAEKARSAQNRLNREESRATDEPQPVSAENRQAIETSPSQPAETTTPADQTQTFGDGVFKTYETDVIRNIAKFGMCDFCKAIDESGNNYNISVLDYIRLDLESDNIHFSYLPYVKIFEKAVSLIPEFKASSASRITEIEAECEAALQAGIDEIRNKYSNMEDIQREEKNLRDRVTQLHNKRVIEFQSSFLEKKLCSDPDDDIRHTALNLISEKYQLSKLHTKYAKIESDFDRLSDLVPGSLWVWKDAILAHQIKEIQNQMKRATTPEEIETLMLQMSELMNLRAQFAKLMGERVIIP